MQFLNKRGMVEGIRTKEQQGSLQTLNKCVENGNTYRCIFPVIKTSGVELEDGTFKPAEGVNIDDTFDIQAFSLPGYKMDLDKMGTTFYPLFDYTVNEAGVVTDLGKVPKLARIAGLFFEAEYRRACDRKKDELEKEAKDMGTEVNPTTSKEAMENLDIEYHGKKIADTMIAPKYQPAVSTRKVCIFTSGLIYKLESDNTPALNADIKGFNMELNATKYNQMKTAIAAAIIDRKKMLSTIQEKKFNGKPLTEAEENYRSCLDDGYIETSYVYSGTSRQDAGRAAAFNLCGESTDSSRARFPEFWAKNYNSIKARLIYDMEIMASKNNAISKALTEEQIRLNFHKYCATNAGLGRYIIFEGDELKTVTRAAEDMLAIEGLKNNKIFYEKLGQIVAEKKENEAGDEIEETNDESTAADGIIAAGKNTGGVLPLSKVLESAGGEEGLEEATSGGSIEEL